MNAYECFSMFLLYCLFFSSRKPLVSFVLVGNPFSFEINMFKPTADIPLLHDHKAYRRELNPQRMHLSHSHTNITLQLYISSIEQSPSPGATSPGDESSISSLLITQYHVHYVGITITYIISHLQVLSSILNISSRHSYYFT